MLKSIRKLGHKSPYEEGPDDLSDRVISIDATGIKNCPRRLVFGDSRDSPRNPPGCLPVEAALMPSSFFSYLSRQ
jgi:hypothetical protein